VSVFGISCDSSADNQAFAKKFEYPFPLLCDTSKAVAIAFRAASSPKDAYARRITYVIGPTGKIEHAIETKDPAGQAAALLAIL
jgi:peroxiredoxin Q/BCP